MNSKGMADVYEPLSRARSLSESHSVASLKHAQIDELLRVRAEIGSEHADLASGTLQVQVKRRVVDEPAQCSVALIHLLKDGVQRCDGALHRVCGGRHRVCGGHHGLRAAFD